MQFSTGNPNLVSLASLLAGQSSTAAGTMYPAQEAKDQVNLAYEELWWDAKSVNAGWGVTRDVTLDAVVDQVEYDIDTSPGDLDGKVLQVAIELDGKALLTDTTLSGPTSLPPRSIRRNEAGERVPSPQRSSTSTRGWTGWSICGSTSHRQ